MDFLIDPYQFERPPPEFFAYVDTINASTEVIVPAHAAGDLLVMIMTSTNNMVPSAEPGWTNLYVAPDDGINLGFRLCYKVDTANNVSSMGTGAVQRGIAVIRNGAIGSATVSSLGVVSNPTLPTVTLTKPGKTLVFGGACANQLAIYTPIASMTYLGDNQNPFVLGPTWFAAISNQLETSFTGRSYTGDRGAYVRSWAVEIIPA